MSRANLVANPLKLDVFFGSSIWFAQVRKRRLVRAAFWHLPVSKFKQSAKWLCSRRPSRKAIRFYAPIFDDEFKWSLVVVVTRPLAKYLGDLLQITFVVAANNQHSVFQKFHFNILSKNCCGLSPQELALPARLQAWASGLKDRIRLTDLMAVNLGQVASRGVRRRPQDRMR
jgi:hypothetical protein